MTRVAKQASIFGCIYSMGDFGLVPKQGVDTPRGILCPDFLHFSWREIHDGSEDFEKLWLEVMSMGMNSSDGKKKGNKSGVYPNLWLLKILEQGVAEVEKVLVIFLVLFLAFLLLFALFNFPDLVFQCLQQHETLPS